MKTIFVFGSNLAGNHAGGAAREAVERWGAVPGIAEGLRGNSYAIPTMDAGFRPLPVDGIAPFVTRFLGVARAYFDHSFLVTAIGCGIAGHKPEYISPLFAGATENVFLSEKLVASLRHKEDL